MFESLIFISIQGAGKRMVVDRQKDHKVGVQDVQSGRQNGQKDRYKIQKTGKGQNQED